MAIQLKRTSSVHTNGIKCLVYGQAGSGKTTLIPTLPSPVVLSAESGLLSISGADVPFIEIKTMDDLREAYGWLVGSEEAKNFQSVALDSVSEIAEVVLVDAKKKSKDPRQAYGELADTMTELIRAFRDLPGKHVYFSAKLEKSTDEMGRIMYAPSMPGQKLGQGLPYFFDLVMALRIERTPESETYRTLMTDSDGLWTAKARGFALEMFEAPDLGAIIKKVGAQ
jgi:phage nucleotide-binding protein